MLSIVGATAISAGSIQAAADRGGAKSSPPPLSGGGWGGGPAPTWNALIPCGFPPPPNPLPQGEGEHTCLCLGSAGHQLAASLIHRTERLFGGDRPLERVVIPRF